MKDCAEKELKTVDDAVFGKFYKVHFQMLEYLEDFRLCAFFSFLYQKYRFFNEESRLHPEYGMYVVYEKLENEFSLPRKTIYRMLYDLEKMEIIKSYVDYKDNKKKYIKFNINVLIQIFNR